MDGNPGGVDPNLFVFKYNAMRFNSDPLQFFKHLCWDLDLAITASTKKKVLIKQIKREPLELTDTNAAEQIKTRLRVLARSKPHVLVLVDEIDGFGK